METDFSTEKPRIAKLTGPNYRPWALQVKRWLQSLELWEVVEKGPMDPEATGTSGIDTVEDPVASGSTDPTGESTGSKKKSSGKGKEATGAKGPVATGRSLLKDAKAATLIMGVCSSTALQHILLLETAKEQWDTLKRLYAPAGALQLSTKVQAFTGYKATEGATVAEIATGLTTLQSEIGDIDPKERPTDSLKIGLLFQAVRALNPLYGPLILQLELSGANKQWETVVAHITEFERQIGSKELKQTALKAETSGNSGGNSGAKKPKGKCYNCGQTGHWKKDCTEKPKADASGDKSTKQSASTGPLPTPGSSKDLMPQHIANATTEACWSTTEQDTNTLNWIVDSGCSRHMTYHKGAFQDYNKLQEPIIINTASGVQLQGIAEGTVALTVLVDSVLKPVLLTGVLHVPGLSGSLISVLQLQDRGITVQTESSGTGLILSLNGKTIGCASRVGRAYILNSRVPKEAEKAHTAQEVTPELLHRRLGHLSQNSVQGIDAVTTGLLGPVEPLTTHCSGCTLAKAVTVINRARPERTTEVLGRVWLDWWGPFSVPSLEGHTNMLTITDEASRRVWVLFGARRDLDRLFTEWKNTVELETGLKVKVVRSDNAAEFRALGARMAPYGMQFEYTSVYSAWQNGVSERLNRTLITVSRAMILGTKLPLKFWQDAVETACYIRNRTPVGPEGKTPIEAYSGKKPDISHLRSWGCLAYARVPKETRTNKLEPTAVQTIFIGYRPTAKQYRVYEPKSGTVINATEPEFHEDKLLQWDWGEKATGDLVLPWDPWEAVQAPIIIGPEEEPEDTIVVDVPEEGAYLTSESTILVPRNWEEAMDDPVHRPYWQEAIGTEVSKLQALDTWEVVDLPPGKKPVGCRFVFALKYTPTGLIDRYKARLVAQGFSQKPGEDFIETFSPTIRAESLRVLLALAAAEDLEIRQVDVVSAYPRSKLHATVYMRPTEALRQLLDIKDPRKVLLLKQSLYGLKQSGREWYIEACRGLKTLGFEPLFSEPSIFRNPGSGQLIGLYVDDMVVLGQDLQAVQATINAIGQIWEIKDLGEVQVILGIRVQRDRPNKTLSMDQSTYIQGLIEKCRLGDAKPIAVPVTDRKALSAGLSGEALADQALYQSTIGAVGWVARGTRFDVSYALNQLSRHCNEPTVRHWNALIRVLRYLKGTKDYQLQFGVQGAYGHKLQGFCDADYAGDADDRASCSGGLWLLNSGAVVWASTKQRSIALSTGESEYIAAAEAAKTGQWLRGLLEEIQRTEYLGEHLSVPIFSDNTACIALAKDPVAHSRTKHIEVRYHYIRQLVAYGRTSLAYLPTEDMLADILTKPLSNIAFQRCIRGLLGP